MSLLRFSHRPWTIDHRRFSQQPTTKNQQPPTIQELRNMSTMLRVTTFSDWVGEFNNWRKEIGVDHDDIRAFKFETLFGAIDTNEIEFGHYKGRPKWENLRQIPTQNMRDALLNMIVYQGDTEFASCEQQRWLFESAPTDYDRSAI